jgi:hypothetical protein
MFTWIIMLGFNVALSLRNRFLTSSYITMIASVTVAELTG